MLKKGGILVYSTCTFSREENEDVMLITNSGTIIRFKVKDVSVLGRSTQGVTLMRTSGDERVVSIETVEPEAE